MPRLETDRLLLRPFNENDLEDFFEYAKMPEIGPNCGWEPINDKEKAIERLNRMISHDYYAIVLKENNKVIGSVSLFDLDKRRYDNIETEDNAKEVGFVLSRDYWGKGYMQEAVKAVLDYAFNALNVEAVYAITKKNNTRSEKLQEKLGFEVVGEQPEVI